jgi:hypothetical protein
VTRKFGRCLCTFRAFQDGVGSRRIFLTLVSNFNYVLVGAIAVSKQGISANQRELVVFWIQLIGGIQIIREAVSRVRLIYHNLDKTIFR